MEPKFCEKCRYRRPTGFCNQYEKCTKWRAWFRREWYGIRRAAALIIESREARRDKLEELRKEYEGGRV